MGNLPVMTHHGSSLYHSYSFITVLSICSVHFSYVAYQISNNATPTTNKSHLYNQHPTATTFIRTFNSFTLGFGGSGGDGGGSGSSASGGENNTFSIEPVGGLMNLKKF
jgi:hypothetical protein